MPAKIVEWESSWRVSRFMTMACGLRLIRKRHEIPQIVSGNRIIISSRLTSILLAYRRSKPLLNDLLATATGG